MRVDGFDWDKGNSAKCEKHGLSRDVIEKAFRDGPALFPDKTHSGIERRFRAVGRAGSGRLVFVVFTIRRRDDEILIRPISARYMHKKEIALYETKNPDIQNG